jgi:hypothetical protein
MNAPRARAQEKNMLYDVSQKITGLDGSVLTGLHGPRDQDPITYARLFITVCANGGPPDTPEDKLKSFSTGLKLVQTNGIVDLTQQEVERIKTLVGQIYTPTIVGRAWEFLASPLPPAPKATIPPGFAGEF